MAFIEGFLAPFRGFFRLVARPAWWPLAAVPIVINVVLLAVLAWVWTVHVAPWAIESVRQGSAWWAEAAEWVVTLLVWVLLMPALILGWLLFAGILGGPFNEALCIKAAKDALGDAFVPPPSRSIFGSVVLAVRVESGNLVVSVLGGLVAFLLGFFFPPIGPVVGGVLFWWLAGYPFLSYPHDVGGRRTRDKLRRFVERPLMTIGFGLAVWILLLPIVTLPFVAPCAVIGSTLIQPRALSEKDDV